MTIETKLDLSAPAFFLREDRVREGYVKHIRIELDGDCMDVVVYTVEVRGYERFDFTEDVLGSVFFPTKQALLDSL